MHFIHRMSFRFKIILLSTLIAVISLVSYHFLSTNVFSSEFLKSSAQQNYVTVNLVNQNLNLLIERSETYIRLLSINNSLQNCLNEYYKSTVNPEFSLRRLRNEITNIASGSFSPSANMLGFCIYNNGELLYTQSDVLSNDLGVILSKEYISKVNSCTTPVWQSDIYPASFSGKGPFLGDRNKQKRNVVTLSKRIIDRDTGKSLGVLVLLMEENALSSLYEGNDATYYLINNENSIVSSSYKTELYKPICEILGIGTDELSQLKENRNIITDGNKGNYMLTLVHNDNIDWDILLCTDFSSYKANRSNVTYTLFLLLIFTVVVITLAMWLSANAVTKPISTLMTVMKKYNGTHPAARVPDNIEGEIGVLGTCFNQLLDKVEEDIKKISYIQEEQHKNELRILQEQIKPHFLYNSLQTSVSLIQLGFYNECIENLYALSDFYKLCLSSGKEFITLAEEISITEKYLRIQHTRYIDKFDYAIDVDSTVSNFIIPKLILQPLVENAIYHGLKPIEGKGSIMIVGYLSDKHVCIQVMDTGVGMSDKEIFNLMNNSSTGKESFGIRNVIERLNIFYGEKVNFKIDSKIGEYTSVIIDIENDKDGDIT